MQRLTIIEDETTGDVLGYDSVGVRNFNNVYDRETGLKVLARGAVNLDADEDLFFESEGELSLQAFEAEHKEWNVIGEFIGGRIEIFPMAMGRNGKRLFGL